MASLASRLFSRLKLSHWSQEDPWTIYRTAVISRVIVEDALRALLASTSSHGRVKEFQQEPVCSQAKQFLDGVDLFDGEELKEDMRELATLMGAARWAWTLEWLGEGEHARTRRDTRASPHHCETFMDVLNKTVAFEQ